MADHVENPLRAHRPLLAIWLLSIPILGLLYIKIAPSPDQAQFNYMAWMATKGYPFYAGSFDMNWPGGMILHKIAVQLFGPSAEAWHLFDFILMQLVTVMAALFLHRARFTLAPFVTLALYPAIYVTAGGWMAGQRDIIAVGVLIAACSMMLAPRSQELRSMALAGALVAMAVLIRPTYVSFLAGLALLELLPAQWTRLTRRTGPIARVGTLVLTFCLVIAAIATAGAWIGNLDDFYQQTVSFTLSAYMGSPARNMTKTVTDLLLGAYHWVFALGLTGLGLWIWRSRRLEYPLLLVLGLTAAIALSYTVQHKGFGYHLGGILPILVMLTAIAFDEVRRVISEPSRTAPGRRLGSAVLAGMALLTLTGTGAKLIHHREQFLDLRNGLAPLGTYSNLTEAEQLRLVEIIRSRTSPDERVVLYGTAYQIPYLAQRLPPYRFINPAVEQISPDFAYYAAWTKEAQDGLRISRPKLILVMEDALGESPEAARRTKTDGRPIFNAIKSYMGDDYRIAYEGRFGVLYERSVT